MKHTKSYFTHSPNPLFARTDFRLLDGIWSFCFDPDNIGVREKWFQKFPSDHFDIRIPYVYQAKNGLNTKTQERISSGTTKPSKSIRSPNRSIW